MFFPPQSPPSAGRYVSLAATPTYSYREGGSRLTSQISRRHTSFDPYAGQQRYTPAGHTHTETAHFLYPALKPHLTQPPRLEHSRSHLPSGARHTITTARTYRKTERSPRHHHVEEYIAEPDDLHKSSRTCRKKDSLVRSLPVKELPVQTLRLLQARPWDSRLKAIVARMCKKKSRDVFLKIYDISEGRAARWLEPIMGVRVEGIWHTGLFCFDQEHFYCDGIQSMSPHLVELKFSMTLKDILYLGKTDVDKHEFSKFLAHNQAQFSPEKYDLISWNCNHFSDLACRFMFPSGGARKKLSPKLMSLVHQPYGRLPEYILRQPADFMSTVRGRLLIWMTKHVLEKVDNFLNENFAAGLDQIIARWFGANRK
eukprot:Blabericola_migrator_1__7403@NODE_376_length_9223_cov_129_221276_g300_i0_p4_GENE_NODE_376_length_9223_cov_129_221276_g300_i0NODE_376_length_9223_cov_129_221276_g300_i0_p4_ORF_typecomplete_len370_score50_84Peptidase_C97/PF05903_14/8_3e24_NODE_376_length_9223_cov_129_221276_g300_i017992908